MAFNCVFGWRHRDYVIMCMCAVSAPNVHTLNAFAISIKYCSHLFILMPPLCVSHTRCSTGVRCLFLAFKIGDNMSCAGACAAFMHIYMRLPFAIPLFFRFRNSVEKYVKLNGNCSTAFTVRWAKFVPSMRINDSRMNLSHNFESKSLISLQNFLTHLLKSRVCGCWREENVPFDVCDLERPCRNPFQFSLRISRI